MKSLLLLPSSGLAIAVAIISYRCLQFTELAPDFKETLVKFIFIAAIALVSNILNVLVSKNKML